MCLPGWRLEGTGQELCPEALDVPPTCTLKPQYSTLEFHCLGLGLFGNSQELQEDSPKENIPPELPAEAVCSSPLEGSMSIKPLQPS